MTINQMFINAIGGTTTAEPIRAYFKGGYNAVYTMEIFNLLCTDKDVECITSEETGEILFDRY